MDTPKKTIFVKLLQSAGLTVGHVVSLTGEFPSPALEAPKIKEEQRRDVGLDSEFSLHLRNFENSMVIYLDFMPFIMSIVPLLTGEVLKTSIHEFLKANAISADKAEDGEIFQLPHECYRDFAKLTERLEPTFDVPKFLARTVLMGLIAAFDQHIRDIMRLTIIANPSIIENHSATLTVKEILSFDNFDDLRRSVMHNELDLMSHEKRDEQIAWFEKKLKIDKISESYPHWCELMEVCERRNLFAHTDGHVSEKYLKNAEKYGYPSVNISLNDKLEVNEKYYSSAVNCIFEFGVMLTHVVRKKLLGKNDFHADSELSELGYRLLQRGDYQLARRILEFAHKARDVTRERTRRMIAVNYANALRCCKKPDEAKEILAKVDWSACSIDFEICVAALRENVDTVTNCMRHIGISGKLTEADYREWPAFFHVRDKVEFKKAYEEIFEIPYIPAPRRRDAISEMVKHLRKATADEMLENYTESVH